jgi:predicted neutral ceramidase superfamily lipid hydrolase
VNATKKSGQKYFNTFMIMKTVKLLSLIIVCGLYLLLIKEQAISFLITFVLFYIIYTIFEAQVSIKLNKKTKDEAAQK